MRSFIHKTIPRFLKLVCLAFVLTADVPAVRDRAVQLDHVLSGVLFNLPAWIATAAVDKIQHELLTPQYWLASADQPGIVSQYLADVRAMRSLMARIATAYADPASADPAAATADLRLQRDALRRSLAARRPLVEAIVQEQIESALRDEGFAVGGQVMPPLRFRMTELPLIMIVSRRDRIERIDQRELLTGLPVDRFAALESAVDDRLDVSSLITPIGGYGTYPTMLPESGTASFVIDTAVHEWTHNYLLPSYVGLNYNSDPVARTINETAAVIVQKEIGKQVLDRYYPSVSGAERALFRPAEQQFDFRAEMRETRLTADALLAAGDITGAERYMEERRAHFVRNGYEIRKLNQAYFAFYGAYNAEPGGAPTAGRDRVGPSVVALRARAPSLYAFVRAIATARTHEDVERALR
jgi:hypothetical protein